MTHSRKADDDKYTGLKLFWQGGDICFNSSDPSSYEKYVSALDKFMKPYKNEKMKLPNGKVTECDKLQNREKNTVCYVEPISIFPCGNNGWHYDEGKPCVIIYYDDSTFKPVPYESLNDLQFNVPETNS